MNPWGFAEKMFNVLSFYGPDVNGVFEESKELRERFDFVIKDVVLRMLQDTSVPISLQNLNETRNYGQNKTLNNNQILINNFKDIKNLAPEVAAIYLKNGYEGRNLDREIIGEIGKAFFQFVSYRMNNFIKNTIKPIGRFAINLTLLKLSARWRFYDIKLINLAH